MLAAPASFDEADGEQTDAFTVPGSHQRRTPTTQCPDSLIDRVEDPVLAEPSGQPRPPRHSAHGLADVSERDVDARRVHRLDDLGEHLGAGDVKAIGAADVDDQCPGGGSLLPTSVLIWSRTGAAFA